MLQGHLRLSPAAARDLERRLATHRWADDDWRRAWSAEYEWLRSSLDIEIEPPELDPELEKVWAELDAERSLPERIRRLLPQRFTLHPNRSLALWADVYRDLSRRSASTCLESRRTEYELDLPREDETSWRAYRDLLVPNSDGRSGVSLTRSIHERTLRIRCQGPVRIALVQTLAGINAYWHETGQLPESLDALVPRHLSRVPRDAYDGAPLRYSKASAVVYGLGEDFVDTGPPDEPSSGDREAPAISVRF